MPASAKAQESKTWRPRPGECIDAGAAPPAGPACHVRRYSPARHRRRGGNKDDWFGSAFIVRLAIVAIVSLSAFLVIQIVRKQPLLHLKLLGRRNFGLGTVANFFFGLSMYSWVYVVPLYLIRIQGYNAEQVGMVLIWLGLPQLVILPFMPKLMKRVDPRRLVALGFFLLIVGSLLATGFSNNYSGPQFIWSSLVRALGQSMVMTPMSAIAVAGIERTYAGSASALFNMIRNLGGAIGIAVLQTFLTKREQFHSDVLTAQVSLLNDATRARLDQLTAKFVALGAGQGTARHEAIIMLGRVVRRQSNILAFSDTIMLQSALLGLALIAVLLLKKAKIGSSGEAH